MEQIDCLIIHTPNLLGNSIKNNIISKIVNFSKNTLSTNKRDFGTAISLLPMGTFAIADLLTKKGYKTKIINLALESNDKYLNIILKNQPKVIAFTLHWSLSTKSVINLIKKIKKQTPNSYIVLGGYTASYFHKQILSKVKEIDSIIRGDSEEPIVKLVDSILKNNFNLSKINNLSWKNNNFIKINKQGYVASKSDLDKLNFTNFKLLHNYKSYCYLNPYIKNKKSRDKLFYAPIGRGCPVNCSFCGGSKFSQKIINNRTNVCFRSIKKTVEMITKIKDMGFNSIYISFDPYNLSNKYYLNLFRNLKIEKIDLNIIFESWGLPNKSFIKSYNNIKSDNSFLVISPFSGSERIRKLNKGTYYSNYQYINTFEKLRHNNIKFKTCYGARQPFEKIKDFKKTILFNNLVKKRFNNLLESEILPIQLDIASLAYENPDYFELKLLKKKFSDFVNNSSTNIQKIFNFPVEELTYYKSKNLNDLQLLLFFLENKLLAK